VSVTNDLGQTIGDPLPAWNPPSAPPKTALTGLYCTVEPVAVDTHLDSLHNALTLDPDARHWTYLPYGPFASKGDYRQWMERTCLGGDPQFYAIVDSERQRAVGLASYLRITPAVGSIEVGHLRYSALLQRRRAATEAMFLMMRNAFDLGYRRYEWKCDSLNAPSRASAERLGFQYEGTFRQHTVVKGRNRDTDWLSILDTEWPAVCAAHETWLAPENFDAEGQQRQSLSALMQAARAALA
jgi:RimJ/RimL family protein N-acetyltransferase